MKTVSEWAANFAVNGRPWLLLGKGPSFSQLKPELLQEFSVMGLNHVSRQVQVTVAHFIDIDAFLECTPEISTMARWVVLPWHPHENFRPSEKTLADYASEIPLLADLEADGRLLTYNLSTAKKLAAREDAPKIDAKFFSAEAGLNLLASCGARVVRSLGIDGGTEYAPAFGELATHTKLANGHDTFDLQFRGIARTIRQTGIQYGPLYVDLPVRIFVGADSTQQLAMKVLEFSVRKFASLSVEFTRIDNRGIREPAHPANRSKTGFSFARFRIPELCNYSGRAIYLDADMQVFADVMDLWNRPFEGALILYAEHDSADGRIPQYSVLVLDCSNLDWNPSKIVDDLDEGRLSYRSLMHDLAIVPAGKRLPSLPDAWNSLEHYVPGQTRLLHYTDMPTQPWVTDRNPHAELWFADLREALDEGFISGEFLFSQIEEGHVSPELPRWLGLDAPGNLSRSDTHWTPPYRRFIQPSEGPSPTPERERSFLNRLAERLTGSP